MYKRMFCFLAVVSALFAAPPSQASVKVLHNFCSSKKCADGKKPVADLVTDGAGNVYGTASEGGSTTACSSGCGVVFSLQEGGNLKDKYNYQVVHAFQGGSDGANPLAGLVFDGAGNLYGTTAQGGGTGCGGAGCGTVFELSTDPGGGWTETVIYRFHGPDGATPAAEVLIDPKGNLFGTTENGGVNGEGTIFQLSFEGSGSWNETVLHNFQAELDGANPVAGLAFDAQLNLWGTARNAGADGFGTIFMLTAAPNLVFEPFYSFTGGMDGGNPVAGLTLDLFDGNLYGTASAGGETSCSGGCGTVFFLNMPDGVANPVYQFSGGTDGAVPLGRLGVNNSTGNLYGTASVGGTVTGNCSSGGCGTAFEICRPGGTCGFEEYTLLDFNGKNGANPAAGMLLDVASSEGPTGQGVQPQKSGQCPTNCIGTDSDGGADGGGDVFQIP
ncbi:MAG: choice-of-anchor tandem repeat GloVer-containing protein [Terriglobales bacterium]